MVAFLLSYGVSDARIKRTHEYLQKEINTQHPFVHKRLWTDDTERSTYIYAKMDGMLIAAGEHGQIPFSGLLTRKVVEGSKLRFDDAGIAASWEPSDGVKISPTALSGAPCISEARIAT